MAILTLTNVQFILLCLITFVILKILKLFRQRWYLQRVLAEFQGPKPSFLHGNTKQISGDFEGMKTIVKMSAKYPGIFSMWIGPFDASLISVHPTTAKHILSGTDPKDEFSYALMRPWIERITENTFQCSGHRFVRYCRDGLLLSKGRKWDRNRRLLTPAFHVDILKSYVSTFAASGKVLVDKWRTESQPVEVFHHISLLTLDSMLKCLFGHDSGCQTEKVRHPYIQAVYDVSELIVRRIINPHHHNPFIYSFTANGKRLQRACTIIHQYSDKLIEDRRKLLDKEEADSRLVDFLDILLSARDSEGNGLSDEEIRDEVDTFMFAGHDSTASTISWCLYNLAKHQNHQDKCRVEVKKFLREGISKITWSDINKMEYTYSCIQESMRLYPPVPTISRVTDKEVTLPDGRMIPSGIRVAVNFYALHRNPDVWENPEEYDPSRFSKDMTVSGLHFMPFSIGPRNCIGQQFAMTQVRVIIAMILMTFRLRLDPKHEAEPESMLILRCKNGLYLNVEKL